MDNFDAVYSPPHYNFGRFEVIEVIEDAQAPYHLGNVIKYLARHLHKGKPQQDLEKGRWYLQRFLEKGGPVMPELIEPRLSWVEITEDWSLPPQVESVLSLVFYYCTVQRDKAVLEQAAKLLDELMEQRVLLNRTANNGRRGKIIHHDDDDAPPLTRHQALRGMVE